MFSLSTITTTNNNAKKKPQQPDLVTTTKDEVFTGSVTNLDARESFKELMDVLIADIQRFEQTMDCLVRTPEKLAAILNHQNNCETIIQRLVEQNSKPAEKLSLKCRLFQAITSWEENDAHKDVHEKTLRDLLNKKEGELAFEDKQLGLKLIVCSNKKELLTIACGALEEDLDPDDRDFAFFIELISIAIEDANFAVACSLIDLLIQISRSPKVEVYLIEIFQTLNLQQPKNWQDFLVSESVCGLKRQIIAFDRIRSFDIWKPKTEIQLNRVDVRLANIRGFEALYRISCKLETLQQCDYRQLLGEIALVDEAEFLSENNGKTLLHFFALFGLKEALVIAVTKMRDQENSNDISYLNNKVPRATTNMPFFPVVKGYSALDLAFLNDHFEAVLFLYEFGAELTGEEQKQLLIHRIFATKDLELINEMIRVFEKKQQYGELLMHIFSLPTVYQQAKAYMEAFIEKASATDLQVRDSNGCTMLDVAYSSGYYQEALFLLERGAQFDASKTKKPQNNRNSTAIIKASRSQLIAEIIKTKEIDLILQMLFVFKKIEDLRIYEPLVWLVEQENLMRDPRIVGYLASLTSKEWATILNTPFFKSELHEKLQELLKTVLEKRAKTNVSEFLQKLAVCQKEEEHTKLVKSINGIEAVEVCSKKKKRKKKAKTASAGVTIVTREVDDKPSVGLVSTSSIVSEGVAKFDEHTATETEFAPVVDSEQQKNPQISDTESSVAVSNGNNSSASTLSCLASFWAKPAYAQPPVPAALPPRLLPQLPQHVLAEFEYGKAVTEEQKGFYLLTMAHYQIALIRYLLDTQKSPQEKLKNAEACMDKIIFCLKKLQGRHKDLYIEKCIEFCEKEKQVFVLQKQFVLDGYNNYNPLGNLSLYSEQLSIMAKHSFDMAQHQTEPLLIFLLYAFTCHRYLQQPSRTYDNDWRAFEMMEEMIACLNKLLVDELNEQVLCAEYIFLEFAHECYQQSPLVAAMEKKVPALKERLLFLQQALQQKSQQLHVNSMGQ